MLRPLAPLPKAGRAVSLVARPPASGRPDGHARVSAGAAGSAVLDRIGLYAKAVGAIAQGRPFAQPRSTPAGASRRDGHARVSAGAAGSAVLDRIGLYAKAVGAIAQGQPRSQPRSTPAGASRPNRTF